MKKEETTGRLDNILKGIRDERDADSFIEERRAGESHSSFHEYFNNYVADHSLIVSEVVKLSGINTNYVYAIINGTKANPGRDKIIALCIACGMNLEETNRALKIAGVGILYSKNERDIRISICINNELRSVTDVNLYLEEHNVDILKV